MRGNRHHSGGYQPSLWFVKLFSTKWTNRVLSTSVKWNMNKIKEKIISQLLPVKLSYVKPDFKQDSEKLHSGEILSQEDVTSNRSV